MGGKKGEGKSERKSGLQLNASHYPSGLKNRTGCARGKSASTVPQYQGTGERENQRERVTTKTYLPGGQGYESQMRFFGAEIKNDRGAENAEKLKTGPKGGLKKYAERVGRSTGRGVCREKI